IHDIWEESGLEMLPFGQQGLLASAVIGSFHKAGKYEFVGPFSGQVSGLIDEIQPAGEVVAQMVEQAVDILSHKLPETVIAKSYQSRMIGENELNIRPVLIWATV
ncbi:MAG: hypothetical protein O7H40_03225, partial [Gammaproteobacteria bacterium]|nr:hypothetical protein [Gammaproteobacteria bacterium]